ncbi:hypothetical protein WA026_012911 [Henosepilachna vigintioctopunctata]|uniref:Uncharacterized protein n=1 Tax=Henosepilachna vigintioctopunctata TaxID=420089 RepID=A0AAW1TTQ9_9CUCU
MTGRNPTLIMTTQLPNRNSKPSASTSVQNISLYSDSNNVITAVLVEKPTEEDSTIIEVGDTSTADHENVNNVCMAHIRAEDFEEPQTSTFFENYN